MIELIPLNADVRLPGDMVGWITQVNIQSATGGHRIVYQVRWVTENREIREEWFGADEVRPISNQEPFRIGFGA